MHRRGDDAAGHQRHDGATTERPRHRATTATPAGPPSRPGAGGSVGPALVYLFSRLCVLLGAAIVAAELGADRLKQQTDFPDAPFADPHYASGDPEERVPPDPRRAHVVGRRLVPEDRPPGLPAPRPAARHVQRRRRPRRVLPRLPDRWCAWSTTCCPAATCSPRCSSTSSSASSPSGSTGLIARRLYGAGHRREGDGADGPVPRQLRAVVRLQRGAAAGRRRGVPAVPDGAAMVVGRGVRRARHGDPTERAGARAWPARSPRSSRSAASATGGRSPRRCSPRSGGSGSRCGSASTPARPGCGSGCSARRGRRAPASG